MGHVDPFVVYDISKIVVLPSPVETVGIAGQKQTEQDQSCIQVHPVLILKKRPANHGVFTVAYLYPGSSKTDDTYQGP